MRTPISDFVKAYGKKAHWRLHMPGHKGTGPLGIEALDITEIEGADSLYEAAGIIAESEKNASSLFDSPTFYSTEGSSQCIRAMLYLACQKAMAKGHPRPLIAAGRNAHKAFLTAAALLDFDILWLRETGASYLSCPLTAEETEKALLASPRLPDALYVTSPDYLGNTVNLEALAQLCHKHGLLLLVDNAHGAYLKFLPESLHPMDLGADLCCDSAHKTLPVLTGGAYLHISSSLGDLAEQAKTALSLFGSTSPSYLTLISLDEANAYLSEDYKDKLAAFTEKAAALKAHLAATGFDTGPCSTLAEPLKLTLRTKAYGYSGYEVARYLQSLGIVAEFADPDHLVLMLTPEIGEEGLISLKDALSSLPKKDPVPTLPPAFSLPEPVLSPRQAMMAPSEEIPVDQSMGRILASPTVGCPPAVPILVSGERISAEAVAAFVYYGITTCRVLTE